MFDISFGRRHARCDGASRRDFLRVGGLTALGLGLPQLLRAEEPLRAAGRKSAARAKSVILVFLSGGLSHTDSFDLKPEAPDEIRGKFSAIDTAAAGVRIGELMKQTAKVIDKVALIRSATHNIDHHETATNWVLSGHFGPPAGDYPAMGAVVAHEYGFTGSLPPYVAVPQNPSMAGELGKSAYLGGRFESFKTGDPNAANFEVPDVASMEPLDAKRANRRRSLLEAVDGLARKVEGNDQLATYDELHRRAAAMTLSGEARSAFAVGQEPERVRERYGRTTFGQSCLLTRRLVERGVRFVTINSAGWDHHQQIGDNLEKMLPDIDAGYSALIEDLGGRGLLGETLVLLMTEFGRTPRINNMNGRDHWGPASSVLMAGAGVRGGQVIGATDKHGAYVVQRPVSPGDVACSVFESVGIDPHKRLVAPDGRPQEVIDQGNAIRELYG
jgi:hypothetical protein